jgi:aspartate 1-decarboxylase
MLLPEPSRNIQARICIFAALISPAFSLMHIEVLKSKIHRAKVTQAELHYVGSITIDEDLLDAANMVENEKVTVVNVNNGERFETYTIRGERGSGMVCLNGPAARRVAVGDIVIVFSYALIDFAEARAHKPTLVFPDQHNRLV